PSGRGAVKFTPDPSRPRAFTKTREPYAVLAAWPVAAEPLDQALTSRGAAALEPSGVLGEVSDEERLAAARPGSKHDGVSRPAFSLKKRAEQPFDASRAPPPLSAASDSDAAETDAQRRARLEQRAEGVTLGSVIDDLRIHAAVPKDKNGRW